jgi:hypothetical protein
MQMKTQAHMQSPSTQLVVPKGYGYADKNSRWKNHPGVVQESTDQID